MGKHPKYYIVCYPNRDPRTCKEALKLYLDGKIGKRRLSRLCGGNREKHLSRPDALLLDVVVADKNYTSATAGVKNKGAKKR